MPSLRVDLLNVSWLPRINTMELAGMSDIEGKRRGKQQASAGNERISKHRQILVTIYHKRFTIYETNTCILSARE